MNGTRKGGESAGGSGLRGWFGFGLSVVAIKAVLLLVDHHPMFFLGDSLSYLWTAISGWVPPDRSFIYGRFIGLVALPFRSLQPLLAVQALMGGVTAVAAAWLLVRAGGVRRRLAFGLGLFCVVEPLQLAYERYVMTESLSLFLFVLYLVLAWRYLVQPRPLRLLMIQFLAVAVVSVRIAYLPALCANAVLLPLLAWPVLRDRSDGTRRGWAGVSARLAGHLAVSLVTGGLLLVGLGAWSGTAGERAPALMPSSGSFQLIGWMPLVEAEDFPDPALGRHVLETMTIPKDDLYAREAHRWIAGGCIDVLQRAVATEEESERIAKATARNILRRDPLGVLGLGLRTAAGFFDRERTAQYIRTDQGDRPLSEETVRELQKHFRTIDGRSPVDVPALSQRLLHHVIPWGQVLLFTPLVLACAWWVLRGTGRHFMLMLLSSSGFIMAVVCVLAPRPVFRYLHPLAWLIVLGIGPVVEAVWQRRTRSAGPLSPPIGL